MRMLFSNQLLPRAKTKSVLSLFGLLLLCATFVRAASVPSWLTEAAKEPVPTSLPKNTVAVELYSEQQTTVKADGQTQTRYRYAFKILRPEGKDYGSVAIYFGKTTPVTYFRAWSIPPQGKIYQLNDKDAVETQLAGGEFYDDLKMMALDIPAADAGNIVAYEYVEKDRPYLFLDTWDFQRRIPVLRANYSLQLPAGWKYAANWANYPVLGSQSDEPNQISWQLSNVPAVAIEDYMPPWRAVAGRVDVKYFSPTNTVQAEQAGSWSDVGLWYANLTSSQRESTPEIQAEVNSLTANAKTTMDKIRAITSYVQRHIRYVAIEIGIGGWRPHTADEVFKNQFGDCKDKATLLMTMLHDAGIQSHYVVVQVSRGIVQPKFACAGYFDHVIVAIELPPDVPTTNLYALVDDPKLRKLLFFDPTDPYTPVGYLPYYEQDNYVLVASREGGELVHLPLSPPATNRLLRVGRFAVNATGGLVGSVREIRWGQPAADSREEYLETAPKDRAKIVTNFLGTFLDNFQLLSASLGDLTQFDQSFIVNYSLSAPDYAKQVGDLILLRPRVLGEKDPDVNPAGRKYPLQFSNATLQTDQFDFTLPPGYKVDALPAPVNVDCGFISYKSQMSVTANVLHYSRLYEVNHVNVPVADMGELHKAMGAIEQDERASVILRRIVQ